MIEQTSGRTKTLVVDLRPNYTVVRISTTFRGKDQGRHKACPYGLQRCYGWQFIAMASSNQTSKTALSALGLGGPTGADSFLLTEEQVELGAMLLHVTQIVEQEFGKGEAAPGEGAGLLGLGVGEALDDLFTFLPIKVKIGLEFGFGVEAGRHQAVFKLVEGKRFGGRKTFFDAG